MDKFVIVLLLAQFCCGFLFKDELCPLKNNQIGVCKVLSDCISAQYDLQVLRKKPGLCGFDFKTPIVCCNTTKQTTTSTERTDLTTGSSVLPSTTVPIQIENRSSLSRKKCQLYSNYVYRNQSSPTLLPGIQYEVINSCNVKQNFEKGQVLSGEYPHLASIGYFSVTDPIYKCTGALISEDYVLTTASCTSTNFGIPQVVRLGTTIKQDFYFEYPEVQHIEVSEFVKHPNYNQRTKQNDIALIKLANPPVINALTRPACLPEEYHLDNIIAVGYGSLDNNGQFRENIQEDSFRLNKDRLCSRRPRGRANWCAKFEGNICVLDAGAPLQVINRTPYCTYTIAGLVVSWDGCDPSKPVSITDVNEYVNWIEKIVWI